MREQLKLLIPLVLNFPTAEEIGVYDDNITSNFGYDLKQIFITYFWSVYLLLLKDGYYDERDGLVDFSVSYNSFHQIYDISLCGGTSYKQKTEKLIQILTDHGYVCDKPCHTWVNSFSDRPHADGLRFFVRKSLTN